MPGFSLAWADPGKCRASAPTAAALPAATVTVTDRTLACAWSLALTRRRRSARFSLFVEVTLGEATQAT
jgi:hypothetical protein